MMLHLRKWRWRWRWIFLHLTAYAVLISDCSALNSQSFKFTQSVYNVSIPESPDGKALAVPNIDADRMGVPLSDPSMDVRFRIVGGDHRKIFRPFARIVGDFAFVSLRTRPNSSNKLNRELDQLHELQVEAWVKGNAELLATARINVEVLDRNDLSPLFYPTRYAVEIDEDVALHTPIMHVTATDADVGLNADIYYTLKKASQNFAIHPKTGTITAVKRPDVDVQKDFQLTVTAQDRGVRTKKAYFEKSETVSQALVSIIVRRVNKHAPFISMQSLPSLFTQNHPDVISTLQVTDADNGVHGQIASVLVVEEPGSSKTGLFFYATDTGTSGQYHIRTPEMARRDDQDSVRLIINATDRGIPSKSTSKTVTVSLLAPNEYAPKFLTDSLTLDVSEGLLVNSLLTQVKAEDGDKGRNGQLEYSLMTATDTFRINNVTGWISLLQPLDRETRKVYELQVTATDNAPAGLRKSTTTKITMRIADENDNDPVFHPSAEATISVAENEPAGTIVYTVTASDQDDDDNGLISYSLANLNELPFQVASHTGQIRLLRRLDHEVDRREFNLRIRAADAGQPFRRESELRLMITVQPKNDNVPALRKWHCRGRVIMRMNATVTSLSALDPDEGDTITYQLLNEEEAIKKCFFVNPSDGGVIVRCGSTKTLMSLLSPERTLNLRVAATDGTFVSEFGWLNLTLLEDHQQSTSTNGDLNRSSPPIECQNNPLVHVYSGLVQQSRENNARIDTFSHTPDVMGLNRWSPKFPSDFPAIVHLDEDLRVDSEVLPLSALDEDYRYNGRLRYAVTSEGDYFRVSSQGQLVLARPLDRETRLTHSLNITAADSGSPAKSSSRLLLIKTVDKNDNSPVFGDQACMFTIMENSEIGQAIGVVHAVDADEGLNGKVTYSLPTPNRVPFAVNPETGSLTVAGRIDFETTIQYRFSVLASDQAADTPRRSAIDCVVVVEDSNDNAPKFPSSLIRLAVPEDIVHGSILAFLQAYDVDRGLNGQIQYGLTVTEENEIGTTAAERKQTNKPTLPFAVDLATGALTVVQALDFETVSFYNVSITAVDGGQPALSAVLWVEIHVEDVDENLLAPKFKDFVTSASVLENQPPDTFCTQVKAVDEDGDAVVYKLVGGSGLHLFRMDNEGTIRTGVKFDRETQEHYWLKIIAQDTAVVPKYSVLFVYIKIGDVNDNCPMTAEPIYYTSVPENSPPDTVVARLEAFDLDTSSLAPSFKITAGNPQGFFTINEKTGVIRTTSRKFDRETQPEHTLEITISDSPGESFALTSTTHVVVSIQDVQDSAVAFLKEHTQRYQVPAWKPPGSLPLLRIVAYDTDIGTNAEIRFALAGKKTENERYRIDAKTGEIFALQPLKIGEDYDVVVKASDPDDSSPKKTLRIVIEASPIPTSSTKPPRIQPEFNTQVLENDPVGHMLLLLEAEDPDGDFLWYYIIDGDPEKQFHIGPNSGNLIVARPLDWESRTNYTLLVNITDGVHFVSTVIRVRVVDVNEHRPQFLKRTFTASVPENSPAGTEVAMVTASDFDEEQRLLYSIYSSGSPDSQNKFHIDEGTGFITTTESLDRETTSQHTLVIVVKDRGTVSRGDLAKVLINVIDMNDHAPVFRDVPSVVVVPAGSPAGTLVTTIEASDQDSGMNGEISFLSYDSLSLFDIDPVTGSVTLLQSAAKLGSDEVAVKVVAVDRGVPPLKSETVILFRTETVSKRVFRFVEEAVTARVVENEPPGTFVAAMTVNMQSFVMFKLSDHTDGGRDSFTVSPSTGVITTTVALDYEKKRSYSLKITSTDENGQMAQAMLTVLVVDVNDNSPKLNFTSIVGSVSESAAPGAMVLDVTSGRPLILTAWDMDDGANKRITFSILESEPQSYFEILPTGSIRLRKSVDFEKQRQFQFHVQVTDGGQPALSSAESAKVTIDVANANDCAPAFLTREYVFHLTIPAFPDFLMGLLEATDADNFNATGILTYKIISGNADKAFSLHSKTGVLQTANSISETGIRSVVVQVSDGVFSTTVPVSIKMLSFEKSDLHFHETAYNLTIEENDLTAKELAVLAVTGSFLNENLKFSLPKVHAAFSLNPVTGSLTTTGVPVDRETTNNVTLIVEVVSVAQSTRRVARVEIFITVLDVNDNAPKFALPSHRVAVPISALPGANILLFNVSDWDEGKNSQLTYSILSDSSNLFSVNSKPGSLLLTKSIPKDASQKKPYHIRIRVSDGGSPALSSETVIEVRLVPDVVPVFLQPEYHVQISEALEIGSPVISVQANYSANASSMVERKIVYVLMNGDPFYNFDLDFSTGVLRLSQPVDFEVQKQYVLRVRAMDPSNWEVLYSDVDIILDLIDANDNAPKTKDGATFHTIRVSESTMAGKEIFQADFTDADSGQDATLQYTLQWSEDAARAASARIRTRKTDEDIYFRCGIQKSHWTDDDFKAVEYFHIDPNTGKINLLTVLDREVIDQLDLTIIVSDLGHPRQSSVMTLRVIVKDVNDNAPCFSQLSYDFVIADQIQPDKFVGGVASVDRDEDAAVHYEIVSGNDDGLFAIDNDGIIRFATFAKGFLQSPVQLTVTASDGVHVSQTEVNILPSMFNRHLPKFDHPLYSLQVPENSAAGTFIGSVHAADQDTGRNGLIRYSIVGDRYDDLVSIDAEKGDLTVTGHLDREEKEVYVFWVQAVDMGGLRDFSQINLTITDVNDGLPVFSRSFYGASILSNSSTDMVLLKVGATDSDLKENSSVVYSIKKDGTGHANWFQIDPNFGIIKLKKPLKNGIENKAVKFLVEAHDRGKPPQAAVVPVEVYFISGKSDLPEFSQHVYYVSIHEDAPVNTTVLHIRLKTKDPVQYHLISSANLIQKTFPFSINPGGRIMVTSALDAEIQAEYHFIVSAALKSDSSYVSHADVRVKIMDENDNAPVFMGKRFAVQAPENHAGILQLLPLQAMDADSEENSQIKYELLGAGQSSPFLVDPESGWLSLTKMLDKETKSRYSLEVKATDLGSPAMSSVVTVDVEVLDVNDNAPYFSQGQYEISVKEEYISETPVIILHATDADQSSLLEYFITNGDPFHNFMINSRGEVFVVSPLDRETKAAYHLTVVASDGQAVAETHLNVTVLDINDSAPYCNKTSFREIIPEDIDVGHIVLRMQATDPDQQNELDYSLVGEGSDSYSMDRATGILRVKSNLDRESQDKYHLLGIAADRDGKSCTASIEVIVTDVNDIPPTFPENLTLVVPEDTPSNTVVFRVRSRDDDLSVNRVVKYSLQAADQTTPEVTKIFAVNGETGLLRLIGEVDREKASKYDLRIRAKDSGSPSLWSMAHIVVSVQNVRDDPPVFTKSDYRFSAPESLSAGAEIGKIEATSLDDAVKEDITYQITDGNQLGHFNMDRKSGTISLTKNLDFEKQPEYVLVVEARESSDPPLIGTGSVYIHVADSNDNAPVWLQDAYLAKISESSPVGSQIIQVSASDADSAVNGKFVFELVNTSLPFAVDQSTGWITVSSVLDRETASSYMVSVRCVDQGVPPLSALTIVEISLLDVNDNVPKFGKDSYAVVLQVRPAFQEKRPVGFTILRFALSDADLDPNAGPFALSIVSGNEDGFFEVRSEDSSLRTTRSLEARKNSEFRLVVRAKDNGEAALFSDTSVVIRVVEESQFPPKISALHITVQTAERSFAGGMIGKVTATDGDVYDSLRFDIVSVDSNSMFNIDSQIGTLFAKPGLLAGLYNLNVSVTDGLFTAYEKVTVSITEITDDVLDNAVVIVLQDVSVEEFVNTYKRDFYRALRQIFTLRRNKDIHLISIQPSDPDGDNDLTDRKRRDLGDINDSIEVLIAIAKGKTGEDFHSADHVRNVLRSQLAIFDGILHTDGTRVLSATCQPQTCVQGECQEELKLLQSWEEPYVSVTGSGGQSFVYPRHRRGYRCVCKTGYGGLRCERFMNDCDMRTCEAPKICMAGGDGMKRCLCPDGRDNQRCGQTMATDTQDNDAMSFNGQSFAWYDLQKPIERHLSVTLKFKTRYGAGNLMYVAGRLDYSILEIKHGVVQYRFDCGSGEGLARLEGLFVSDNQWHELSVQRHGRHAEIRIDGKYTAHATAPGINDILNLEGNDAFFGAEVPGRSDGTPHPPFSNPGDGTPVLFDIRRGFIGCMKNIQLNGVELPRVGRNSEATLRQLAQIQPGCHISSDELGPCASMPCQNGGLCQATSKTTFSCRCPPRYLGIFCENDSNPCASNPCLMGGCTNRLPNDFYCACPSGLTGKRCEYGQYCNPNPCQNGGCEEGSFGPICQCFTGYEGTRCERDVDECLLTPCHNGGVCENLLGGFRCNCSVQTRGTLCDDVIYVPNMTTMSSGWGWIEILIIISVIIAIIIVMIFGVLCRRKFRKRRAVTNALIIHDHTGSPSSQNDQTIIKNNINSQDDATRNKYREKVRIGPEDLLKRGSKISNLEVEARQPFLYNSGDSATSSIRAGYGKTRFRNPPLTPPPPSLSGASSETASVKKSLTNINIPGETTNEDAVKGCVVDLPSRSVSTSGQRNRNRGDPEEMQPLTSHASGSAYGASVSTSPMNSEHDGPASGVLGVNKALEWDPSGTDFETAENTSNDTGDPTVSADGHYRPRGQERDRSLSETESLLDTDFAEDDAYYETVLPPTNFQDMLAKPEDDYAYSVISKRFSDYIPSSELDSYMDDETPSKAGGLSGLGEIPPPMPTLDGYTSIAKKRDPVRVFISEEILSGYGGPDEQNEPETTSLLNGHAKYSPVKRASNRHAWSTELNGDSKPFSSLLGKQTQV